MNIRGILATKGNAVATIPAAATILEATQALAEHGVGALVVSDDGHLIDGILSERDVARGIATHGAAALELRVDDLMTAQVVTCDPSDSVERLARVMSARRIRHVPVAEGGSLAGIVSIGDIVKSRLDELETERQTLHEYIAAGR
jgi:CBS domain-containing protein